MTAELDPQYADVRRAAELMTVNDVAALLKASPSWVYRRTYDKHDPLPCLKLHGAVRFRLADLEEWLDAHQRASTPPAQAKWGVVLGKPRVK